MSLGEVGFDSWKGGSYRGVLQRLFRGMLGVETTAPLAMIKAFMGGPYWRFYMGRFWVT